MDTISEPTFALRGPSVKFTFVSDPGHGWLILSPQWIGAVGLTLAAFSQHSYVAEDGTLALEEDCDAPKFLEAYARCFGQTASFHEIFEDPSSVRDWYPLHATMDRVA